MNDLIVITFDARDDAARALAAMRTLEQEGALKLSDSAVVVKDAGGTVDIWNEASTGAETGAMVGGAIGLLTTFIFPVVGAIAGAAAGAWIGSKFGDGAVDGQFVADVGAGLQPGMSALFLTIADADPAALRGALDPFAGRVHQTTLSEEFKQTLAAALKP